MLQIEFGIAAGLPKATLPAASLTDRLRPLKQGSVLKILAVTTLVLLGTYTLYTYIAPALSPVATSALAPALVWAAVWGVTVGCIVTGPAAAPAHRPQPHRHPRLGLNSSAIYVGIALGGGFGGLAQESPGIAPAELGIPAAAITALTLLYHLITIRRRAGRTLTAPAQEARAKAGT